MTEEAERILIVTGSIAEEGARRIVQEEPERFSERFSPYFLKKLFCTLPAHEPDMRTPEEKAAVIRKTASVFSPDADFFPVADGGIFAALWKLSQEQKTGFEVTIGDIPIRQEVIEVCEETALNPYAMRSGEDVILIAAQHGIRLLKRLEEQGIKAACIGFLTENADRLLHQGEQIRYLNRPQTDEWIKYQTKRKEARHARNDLKGN